MNSLQIKKIENSNAIQVYASDRSIWRGNPWSCIKVNIKLDKYFIPDKKNTGSPYILRAYLEDYSSRGSFICADADYFKVCFKTNGGGNQQFSLVTLDPYYKIDVQDHKKMFSNGDKFRVIIIAEDHKNHADKLIFGASQTIA